MELLPCPFCGFMIDFQDEDTIYQLTRDNSNWVIVCLKCNTSMLGDSEKDCISKWNSRKHES